MKQSLLGKRDDRKTKGWFQKARISKLNSKKFWTPNRTKQQVNAGEHEPTKVPTALINVIDAVMRSR